MADAATITTVIDPETMALLARLASEKGVTEEQFAADAIRRVAESEADFSAFIQAGVAATDRGDVLSHEEVMADLRGMIAHHQARCPT